MSELIEQAAEVINATAQALAGELTTAQCIEHLSRVAPCLMALEQRFELIRLNPKTGFSGAERQKLLETGTTEELAALALEAEQVEAKMQRIRTQHTALNARRNAARAQEASQALPGMHKAFSEALGDAEKALEALKAALAQLDQRQAEIWQASQLARGSLLNVHAGDVDTVRRAYALSQAVFSQIDSRTLAPRHLGDLAETLNVSREDQQGRAA